ncbi:MAG: flippase [Chloroflexi bacterium]|nr:flippase [Chloroflexota bacterium]MCC6895690.1 flippase [Anaerolineae bacterium]
MTNDNNTPTENRSAGRIILRNTLFGVGSQIALRIVSFLFQIFVIRTLGDAEFGTYNVIISWVSYFQVLGDLGITQYFRREIARDRSATGRYFWDMVVLRLLLAVVTSIVTIGSAFIFLTPYSSEKLLAIALFCGTYFFQAFLYPLLMVIEGNERVDISQMFNVIGQIVILIAGFILVSISKSFFWLIIAGFINIPVLIFLAYRVVKRNNFGPPSFHINRSMWWGILQYGLPFGLIQFALTSNRFADRIVLNQFQFSAAEIGWYSIAYNLTLNFTTLAQAFNDAFQPTLAREHAGDPTKAPRWYFRSVKMMLFLALPIAIGGMLLSEPLISTLYKPQNRAAYIAFFIIIWDLPAVLYNNFCGNMTTAIVKERAAARINVTQSIVNIVVNIVLIRPLGMIGAAFATVISDTYAASLFYLLFRREFGPGLGFKHLLRVLASAIGMGAVIVILHELGINLFITIALGVVVYLAFIWLTKAFTDEERALIRGIVQRVTRKIGISAQA